MSYYPDADYLTGAYQPGQFWADEGAEVAFAGRSNSGKSSAINVIVNRNNFARVSKSPGPTGIKRVNRQCADVGVLHEVSLHAASQVFAGNGKSADRRFLKTKGRTDISD